MPELDLPRPYPITSPVRGTMKIALRVLPLQLPVAGLELLASGDDLALLGGPGPQPRALGLRDDEPAAEPVRPNQSRSGPS